MISFDAIHGNVNSFIDCPTPDLNCLKMTTASVKISETLY